MFGDERKGGIGCRDLCIQEQWLLTDIVALNLSDDFLSVGIIVMDSHQLILGPPYGSCGVLCCK